MMPVFKHNPLYSIQEDNKKEKHHKLTNQAACKKLLIEKIFRSGWQEYLGRPRKSVDRLPKQHLLCYKENLKNI